MLGLDDFTLVDDGSGGTGTGGTGTGGTAGAGGTIAQECTTADDCTGDLGECDEAWECPAGECVKIFKAGGEPCNQNLEICSGQGYCGDCVFDERQCDENNTVEVCTEEGQWQTAPSACEGATPVCSTGDCRQVLDLGLGGYHHCAVLDDGHVRCWGDDYEGQLGTGALGTTSDIPVEVINIDDAVEVSVGSALSCAKRSADSLWCWGKLDVHNDTDDDSIIWLSPSQIATGILDFDVGSDAICYITSSGSVMCVGSNFFDIDSDTDVEFDPEAYGESGINQAEPIGIANGLRVSLGYYAVCVITNGFTVLCAGDEDAVGNTGLMGSQWDPAPVANLVVSVDHDIDGGDYLTCVSRRNGAGNLDCWGQTNHWSEAVTSIYGTTTMHDGAVGGDHFCALDGNDVKCRGDCSFGQCGTNETGILWNTTTVLSGISKVWAGSYSTCARQIDDQIVCWGMMNQGQTDTFLPGPLQWVAGD